MTDHKVVSEGEWTVERKKLLEREKELTHLQEQIAAERRALAWVRVDKTYTFDTPEGKKTLSELFDGRSQLIVYHFMYGPAGRDGLRRLLFPLRPCRRRQRASQASRRVLCRGVARTSGDARGLQEAHGLEIPLGVVGGQRFQLRLSCLVHQGRDRERRGGIQFREDEGDDGRPFTAPASSSRTRMARSITPTRPMRAATSAGWAPTCIST